MKKINNIMVCMDFSDYSRSVFEYALAFTKGTQTQILLYNVINIRDIDSVRTVSPYFAGAFTVESYIEKLIMDRKSRLEELTEQLCPGEKPRIRISVSIGVPFEKILEKIAAREVDLVFMGNKGRSNIVGTLFGSNAEKVFRHSTIPVVSYRDRERFSRTIGKETPVENTPKTDLKRIIAAVDFSVYSPDILEYASEIAVRNSAEIVVVNVINNKQIESFSKVYNEQHPNMFSIEKFIHDETGKRTANLNDLMKKSLAKDIPTRIIIRSGTPFEEIIKVVDSVKADLLIINSKGRSNIGEYLFGTTAEKTFRHSTAPVLSLNMKK